MNVAGQLINLLSKVPAEHDEARVLLKNHSISKSDLARIAIELVNDCFYESVDMHELEEKPDLDALHSGYLVESLRILLENGLDPNDEISGENAMWVCQYIDVPNIGAAALRILLEHGGDPNHKTSADPETLFEQLEFSAVYDLTEGENDHSFANVEQCLWVLIAFGGCFSNGEVPIEMLNGKQKECLRYFEKYDYYIEQLPPEEHGNGNWRMHIYDVETREEVALF